MSEILTTLCEGAVSTAKCAAASARSYWDSLDENVVCNKQQLVLGAALLTVSGVILGMLCSPRKEEVIIDWPPQSADEEENED